jgi:hypothetical protein
MIDQRDSEPKKEKSPPASKKNLFSSVDESDDAPLFQQRLSRTTAVLLGLGLLIYTLFLGFNMGAYAGGSDSSGYLNNARLLRKGRIATGYREIPGLPADKMPGYTYVPLGFRPAGPHKMVPTYPIGLPLLINIVASVAGVDAAPSWTISLHAIAGVVIMFLLCCAAGLTAEWAAFGALLLGVCPVTIFFSIQMMSDVPATTWALATILLAWLSRRDARLSPAAGLALGVAVLVRPTNLLLAIPAAVALGANWRRWLGFVAGGVPPAFLFLTFNYAAYGHVFASGYGRVDYLFRWEYLPVSLAHYAKWMPVLLTPFGLLALGLPLCGRRMPRWSILLVAWGLPVIGLYAFYFHTHEDWWYLRFGLPAFPAFWIAALLVTNDLLRRANWRRLAPRGSLRAGLAGVLLGAVVFAYAWHWNDKLGAARSADEEKVYIQVVDYVRSHVPPNAVIIAMQVSGSLFYYTEFPIVRWDQIKPTQFSKIAKAASAAKQSIYAVFFPFEEERAFPEHRLTGRWTKIDNVRHVSLWRYEPDV